MDDVPANAAVEPCNRLVYVLLAFGLGNLGIHNFYAGYRRRGWVQLGISLVGLPLVLPPLLVSAWAAAEMVKVRCDAAGVPFVERGWTKAAVLVVFSLAVMLALGLTAATLWVWYSFDV